MKNFINILYLVLFTVVYSVNAQTLAKVNQKAIDIAITPNSVGSVYIIDEDRIIRKFNNKTSKFDKVNCPQPRTFKKVETDFRGNLYTVDIGGYVHQLVNNRWVKRLGVRTNDIFIDAAGNKTVIDLQNNLYVLSAENEWIKNNETNGHNANPKHIISLTSAEYFMTTRSNRVKRFWLYSWSDLSGKLLFITSDKKNKEVYGIGMSRRVFKWDKKAKKWDVVKNTDKNLKTIAVRNKMIWGIDTKNQVYRPVYSIVKPKTQNKPTTQNKLTLLDNRASTQTVSTTRSNQFTRVNSADDISGKYRIHILKLVTNKKDNKYFGTAGLFLEAKTKSGNLKIRPLNGSKDRYLDISKTTPKRVKYDKTTVNNKTYNYSIDIDKIREFNLIGDVANKNATFDFQYNIKKYGGPVGFNQHDGGWIREKIKVNTIKSGEKAIFSGGIYDIVYTITKTN